MDETRIRRVRAQQVVAALLVLTFVLGACSPAGGGSGATAPTGESGAAPAAVQPSGPFRAVATSAISVDLSWDPVEGATGYRIENQFGDSEWFILGEVGGAEASYEDFMAPSDTELNYRLVPLKGDQEAQTLTTSVTTPAVIPNPYSVVATLEEPDYSAVGLDIPGFDPSTFDPSTFDPSTLDLSGVNPENLDLSSLEPEPVSALARMGPEGGTLSVTGKNGVIYTLDVPPHALPFTTILVMTPYQTIDGYPFSGGYDGAVQIRPEGLYFDVPATLTFQVPVGAGASSPADSDLIHVGFAFEGGGKEFHLVPIEDQGVREARRSGSSAKLASPRAAPVPDPVTMAAQRMNRTGSAGSGRGTRSELKDFKEKSPPTDHGARSEQEEAARKALQEAEQQTSRRAAKLLQDLRDVSDINVLVDIVLTDFRAFYETDDYLLLLDESVQEALWEALIDALNRLLLPQDCPSPEAAAVQELVTRILYPVSPFDAELSSWIGDTDRIKVLDSVNGCHVKLVLRSTVVWSDEICSWTYEVSAEIPLAWRVRNGKSFLQGAAPLKYENAGNLKVSQGIDPGEFTCLEVKFTNLDSAIFTVVQLRPEFEDDVHTDWSMAVQGGNGWTVAGEARQYCRKYRDDGDPDRPTYESCVPLPGKVERDLWGGSVTLLNLKNNIALGGHDWKIDRDEASALKAEWPRELTQVNGSGEGWRGSYAAKLTLTNR